MEILKRARGASDGEMSSWSHAPPNGLQDELNQRTYKAGYTDRDGQCKVSPEIVSKPSNDKYRQNYARIFGHD